MRNDRAARSLIFVLDENLSGRRIVDGLAARGIHVKPQTDLMPRGITDEEVLTALARHPDCCLLTKDKHFHMRPVIRSAILEHGIGTFVITSDKGKTASELVELIAKAWNRIQQFAREHHPPFIVKILANGRIMAVKL